MTAARRWVAIDGGQSGLRLIAGSDPADDRISARGTGPGFSYQGGDTVTSITEAVRIAATEAGLTGPVDVACLGLTGNPHNPDDSRRLGRRIAGLLDATEVRLFDDMVTAHAGALPERSGVVIAAGSGVVLLGIGSDGQVTKVDGNGYLLGDVGSGFAVGHAGLRAVFAAEDGRGEPTALSERAIEVYGRTHGLPQRLAASPALVSEIAAFTTEVFAAATDGDPVASAIVTGAAADLAHSVAVAVRNQAGTATVPVAYTGGLFDAGEILLRPFRERLAREAPRAELRPAVGSPLDGARRLAREELGPYAPLASIHREEKVRPHTMTASPRTPHAVDGTGETTLPFPAGSLLVSCQARMGNPLHSSESMALMAKAAAAGGAVGIRANGPADIAAIRSTVDLPIIGINKVGDPAGVWITPTFDTAAAVVEAGATLVAIDGTTRPRPDGGTLIEQITRIHAELGVLVMADVDTVDAGIAARAAGADLIATTLSGYTSGIVPDGPDIDLVAALVERLDCPVLAEGRYWTPGDIAAAREAGAYAVIVGTAITNPLAITTRLAKAMR